MGFAAGRKALAICDRCGLQYPLTTLRAEWTGHKVCGECWEPKHPQLEVMGKVDQTALRGPRPGNHTREDIRIRPLGVIGYGICDPGFVSVNEDNTATGVQGDMYLGTTGLFIGTLLFPSGVSTTSALGTAYVTISDLVTITGFESTMNTPNVGITVDDEVMPAGLASTTSLGTATVNTDSNGWGFDTWGHGAWGQ